MKKFGLLLCSIGLFVSFLPTVQAETNPICNVTAPESCFFVVGDPGKTRERKKRATDSFTTDKYDLETFSHCPETNLEGLKDDSMLTSLYTYLHIDQSMDSVGKMESLQFMLSMTDSCGDKICAPIGKKISENTLASPEGKTVTCSIEHFDDGKYGVCTKEAIRRYLAYIKAETTICDTKPQLIITVSPTEIKQQDEVSITVTETNGKAYKWVDEPNFIARKTPLEGAALAIENVILTINNNPQSVTLDQELPLAFLNTGEEILSATGGIVGAKPSLEVLPGTSKINVLPIEKDTDPVDAHHLSCKQLLPKYLVGASCDPDLYGDARDITYWIQKFSGKITTFIAALAVLLIAWNAFGLVMAGGDTDTIATSKKALMWVGIGLLLVIFAYVIVKTAISLSFMQ